MRFGFAVIVLLCLGAAAIAGCGKRGELSVPPGSNFPRTYPNPAS